MRSKTIFFSLHFIQFQVKTGQSPMKCHGTGQMHEQVVGEPNYTLGGHSSRCLSRLVWKTGDFQRGAGPEAESRKAIRAHCGDMMTGSLGANAVWRFEGVAQAVNNEEICQQTVEAQPLGC